MVKYYFPRGKKGEAMIYLLYPLSVILGIGLTTACFYITLVRVSDENVLLYVFLTCLMTYFLFQALQISFLV